MVSELLCTTHKNANCLACGRLRMGRKAKAMSALSVWSALFRTTVYPKIKKDEG